jgi:type IX secretion system PorP/SprF family membrane protein
MNRLKYILLFFAVVYPKIYCQETDPVPTYQTVLMNNPAMSGSGEAGTLRISYLNFYPGNGYNLHSLYVSYDSYFSEIHGGAALYLTNDYLGGHINNIRGGVSYSYFLQATENIFINAGLTASVFHQGFNFANAVLPDMIDPTRGVVYPSSEILVASGRTVFDIGTGFTVKTGKISGGLAVLHLSEPDLSKGSIPKEIIKRKLYMHLYGDFIVGNREKFSLKPIVFSSVQDGYFIAGAGASLENERFAINAITMDDSVGNMNLQTGFSLPVGALRFNYSYRFNVVSKNVLLPVSLLHQAGIAFNLNNIDKKNRFNTIKFPEL